MVAVSIGVELAEVEAAVGATSFKRGKTYARAHRVLSVAWDEDRSRLHGQLRIYTAQGRITGLILCVAPFVMCGVLSLLNWRYERLLFTHPTGLKAIYVGLVMMVLGVLIIRKIIDIKV